MRKRKKVKKFSVPQIQVNIKHENQEQIYDNYSKPASNAQEHELALRPTSPAKNEADERKVHTRRLSLKSFNKTPLSRYFSKDQSSTRSVNKPLMASTLLNRHSELL